MKRNRRRYLSNQPYVKRILALFPCFVLLSRTLSAAAAENTADSGQLVAGLSAGTPENVGFIRRIMTVNPEMTLLLFALAVGVIFFCMRLRWNNKLRAGEKAKRDLEEQLAIVNALAWEHYTVYALNIQTGIFRAVKVGSFRPPKWHWET